jgi:hypothetical protein
MLKANATRRMEPFESLSFAFRRREAPAVLATAGSLADVKFSQAGMENSIFVYL